MVTKITQVTNESEYATALMVVDSLINADPYSEQGDELDRIADLIVEYEAKHYPMENTDPKSLIEFMIDQRMVTLDQVLELLGGDVNIDSVIACEYEINDELAQMLHERSGVPVEYFLQTSCEGG